MNGTDIGRRTLDELEVPEESNLVQNVEKGAR